MPYPNSPFEENFNSKLIIGEESNTTISNIQYDETLEWLCSSPKITSYRVNTIRSSSGEVLRRIRKRIFEILDKKSEKVNVEEHSAIPNVVIVNYSFHENGDKLEKYDKEIIVDVDCASAVLRGAHVYAPGVIGMMSGTQIGDNVSIYADIKKHCKKGLQKLYDGPKIFIGNGIAKKMRHELFGENLTSSGVAIQVTETLSGCPPLGDDFLPSGSALLQNLPSILCVYALDPQPNETVLDMCAAPGNKTTHIAELMQNKGILVAIDKTSNKIQQLKKRCSEFGAEVNIFEADSTKIISNNDQTVRRIEDGPPFLEETFDRILLDAPCSVLGKRPQLANRTSEKVVRSYVPLQRKLFHNAVKLLKVNGTLVYSTCTITLAENEAMLAWALRTFNCLKLVKPTLSLGGPGWKGTSLSDEERGKVQRFGPGDQVDSVGFFFACFMKM